MRRLPALLQALAVALVLAGLVLLAWRPGVGRAAGAPTPTVASAEPLPVPDPDLTAYAQAVVDGDVFAADRRPPAVRWVPGEDPDASMDAGVPDTTTVEMEPVPGEEVPALFGTLVGGETGAKALLRLDAAAPAPQLYGVGDRAGGYRVVQITDRSVTLDGPQGRVVLRLPDTQGKTP